MLAVLAAYPAAAGPTVETFVLAVGGQSNYPTFGPPSDVSNFFGGYGVSVPSNPAGLAASNIAGGFRKQTAAGGPIADSTSVTSANFGTTWASSNVFTGSSAANAVSGKVGSEAHGTFSGWGDSFTVVGAEAYGAFQETMTFNAPSVAAGSAGSIVLRFGVDGSMTATGSGTAGMLVNYQQDSGPIYTLMRAQVDPTASPVFYQSVGSGHAGFSVSSTSISGSGEFDTFALPITWGSAFDFKLGLHSFILPGRDSTLDVQFYNSALLTAIDAYGYVMGSDGVTRWSLVDSFSVQTASGALYDAEGVHLAAIPEASTIALAALGIAVGALSQRWRRRAAP